jgi:hypothetical protein
LNDPFHVTPEGILFNPPNVAVPEYTNVIALPGYVVPVISTEYAVAADDTNVGTCDQAKVIALNVFPELGLVIVTGVTDV